MRSFFIKNRIPVITPLVALFLFCTTEVSASYNNPILFGDEKLIITLDESTEAMFQMFSVNDQTNQVDIVTNKLITSIQVFDAEGQVIYFLPIVGSEELNVGTNLFETGTYYIYLGIEGQSTLLSARVDKK